MDETMSVAQPPASLGGNEESRTVCPSCGGSWNLWGPDSQGNTECDDCGHLFGPTPAPKFDIVRGDRGIGLGYTYGLQGMTAYITKGEASILADVMCAFTLHKKPITIGFGTAIGLGNVAVTFEPSGDLSGYYIRWDAWNRTQHEMHLGCPDILGAVKALRQVAERKSFALGLMQA